MNEIIELITVVQALSGTGAAVRIVYLILENLNADDQTARNKKIKNVLIVLIMIETVLTAARIVRGYY